MVFSSLGFLFFFLPIVLIGYYFIPVRYSNTWLMLCSLLFYYLGDKNHIGLLLVVIAITYIAGMVIQKSQGKQKRVVLILSVGLLIIIMSYYKYWDFLITNINQVFSASLSVQGIAFPIGISFFVFQAISYIFDVYREEKALSNYVDLALYISFFPQLIAGPIVRFKDINEYMGERFRKIKSDDIEEGTWRFCTGLSKKVLLANNLGVLANIVFGVNNIHDYSVMYSWLGAVAYTLQIYFDFSGYSDMAIGLGRVFGFRFQENFNYPYTAKSIKEFWRRWHISLSQFFRDYVYIPLGGDRCSWKRWLFNISCVWLLTGIWHGASWTYIVWGVLYGLFIVAERLLEDKCNIKTGIIWEIASHIYTMMVVIILWVLFKASSLNKAVDFVQNMFGIGAAGFVDQGFMFQLGNNLITLLLAVVFCLPVMEYLNVRMKQSNAWETVKTVCLMLCTIVAVSYIYMGSYNPFLYFMF